MDNDALFINIYIYIYNPQKNTSTIHRCESINRGFKTFDQLDLSEYTNPPRSSPPLAHGASSASAASPPWCTNLLASQRFGGST